MFHPGWQIIASLFVAWHNIAHTGLILGPCGLTSPPIYGGITIMMFYLKCYSIPLAQYHDVQYVKWEQGKCDFLLNAQGSFRM
jgi:hypothetical protein